jgi:hypothetical protein
MATENRLSLFATAPLSLNAELEKRRSGSHPSSDDKQIKRQRREPAREHEKVEVVFKDRVGYDATRLIESARGYAGLH